MEVRWRNWDLDWDRTWRGFEITWMELWMEVRRDLHGVHMLSTWSMDLDEGEIQIVRPGCRWNRTWMEVKQRSLYGWMEVMWAIWGWDASLGTWIEEICDLGGAERLILGPGWRWDANTDTWIDMRRNLDGVEMQIAGPREPRWRWDVIWVKLRNTLKSREVEGCETQVPGHGWTWLGWGWDETF